MEKTISAGIIVRHKGKFVIGHATGGSHFDIFKGRAEKGETLYETAVRECYEESSLNFKGCKLKYFGFYEYTKKKNLAIFMADIDDLNMDELHCISIMENGLPEMDYYELVTFDEMISKVAKNMKVLLLSLEKQINSDYIQSERDWMPSKDITHDPSEYDSMALLEYLAERR